MWIINKTTGIKWDIEDKELIERLTKDDGFEVVIVNYNDMSYFDLQKLAKEAGINTHKQKKEDLIKALEALKVGG